MLQEEKVADPAPAEPPPPSLAARVASVFGAPGEAGEALARRPQVLGALLLCVALSAATVALLYYTEPGRAIVLEQFKAAMRQSGQTGAGSVALGESMGFIAAASVIGAAVGTAAMVAIIAGLLWMTFSAVFGASLGYRQYFAIAAHAGLISGAGGLLTIALMLAKHSPYATLSLAAFAPRASLTSPLYMSLALFDFFTLWWIVALGLMVARAGRLGPASAVGTLLAIYFVLGGAGVAVRAALS